MEVDSPALHRSAPTVESNNIEDSHRVAIPRTRTSSRAQLSAVPRRIHALHGMFLSHFTFRDVHDLQLFGARWVVRSAAVSGFEAGLSEETMNVARD